REGPDPHNLVMLPGTSSTDEMVSGTRKGILVTRFWYDNVVDSKKTLMTGLSRDGTFLIENGKITRAVGSLRYNESILGGFSRAQALGRNLKGFSFGTSHIACPSMLIEEFCFTGSREKYQDW
ncbi:MAG: TldD/PmbA family protein, partial [Armatimonadetes bacterium]|nr:TldD/PmbA family protein [Armatimonadota bacterium]